MIEDPERMSLFEIILKFFDRRIKKNRDAIKNTEDTDRALLMKKALICFYRSGYRRECTIIRGMVWCSIPGEGLYCYMPDQVRVIQVERY